MTTAAESPKPRRRPSIARAIGFMALGWALATLIVQTIVAARSSSLPATVHVFLPGYRAGQSTVMNWTSAALVGAGWGLTVALVIIAGLGIVLASDRRFWIGLALVIIAAVGAWLTAAYAGSALLQVDAPDVPVDLLRSVVDPLAIVAIIAVLVTVFFGVRLISYGTLGRTHQP